MAGRARAAAAAPSKRLRRCILVVPPGFVRQPSAEAAACSHLLAHLVFDRVEQAQREVARHALRDEHHARGVVGGRPAIEELRRRERRAARRGSPRAVPAFPRCPPAPSPAAAVRRNVRPALPAAGSAPAPGWGDRAAATKVSIAVGMLCARERIARRPVGQRGEARRDVGAGEQCRRRDVAALRAASRPGLSAASRSRSAVVGAAMSVLLSSSVSASATCRRASG